MNNYELFRNILLDVQKPQSIKKDNCSGNKPTWLRKEMKAVLKNTHAYNISMSVCVYMHIN